MSTPASKTVPQSKSTELATVRSQWSHNCTWSVMKCGPAIVVLYEWQQVGTKDNCTYCPLVDEHFLKIVLPVTIRYILCCELIIIWEISVNDLWSVKRTTACPALSLCPPPCPPHPTPPSLVFAPWAPLKVKSNNDWYSRISSFSGHQRHDHLLRLEEGRRRHQRRLPVLHRRQRWVTRWLGSSIPPSVETETALVPKSR